MFDYNCDLTPTNSESFEMAELASSVNICAGLFSGDPLYIKNALEMAKKRELALGALVECENINLSDDELFATIVYQIGAVMAFANSMSLQIENVAFKGASKDEINKNIDFARKVVAAVHFVNPWFNIFLNNFEIIKVIEAEFNAKCAYEVDFIDKTSIREIREMEIQPLTLHFESLENLKRAYDVIKPSPVSYNRVFEVL